MIYLSLAYLFISQAPTFATEQDHPLSIKQRTEFKAAWTKSVTEISKQIAQSPKQIELYSKRGDAYFFLGEFEKALADYDQMVELNPQISASHWRRGIACYFVGKFEEGVKQFDAYRSFDDVDRENGIWRFFCQARLKGIDVARKDLIRYKSGDRAPLPQVYQLFRKQTTAEDLLQVVDQQAETDAAREMSRFYSHLYIGLLASIEKQESTAKTHLQKSIENTWGPKAGYGPRYMWHVGRLEFERLQSQPETRVE